jgi:predicted amino acid dehydrogenase
MSKHRSTAPIQPDTFAFIIHPIDIKRDVARKYPILGKYLTEGQINYFSQFFPPVYLSQIDGITSQYTHHPITGWFIAAPYTPPTMMRLPVEKVYRKIVACGHMASELGAKILGLGAYTSVVGDGGITIAERLEMPVTNGDSYTVFMAVEAVRQAAQEMNIPLQEAKAAVVGATGTIGAACAELLAGDVAELVLVGKRPEALEEVVGRCQGRRAHLISSTDMSSIYSADLILTVTSAVASVIEPEHLKPGAVVCDVARPRDVSWRVHQQRDDVLVIEGGMVEVPGPVNFNFDFGFPSGKSYACMAETMVLAMEGRYEDYSLGKHITLDRVLEIAGLASKHGFKLSGFRSFERAVSQEHIDRVRDNATRNRLIWKGA